jgi:hypothetical protein
MWSSTPSPEPTPAPTAVAVTEQYACTFANSNPCTFANSNPYTYTSANSDTNSYITANRGGGRICTSSTSTDTYPYD